MKIQLLSKEELQSQFKKLVASERKITGLVLQYIAEIDRRRLYLEHACTSLFEYLVKVHGYSAASAMRRIDGARLLREVPEVSEKIAEGKINLSQVSRLQQAVREVEKNESVSCERKADLIEKISGASTRETDEILGRELGFTQPVFQKVVHHRDYSKTLTFTFTSEEMKLLENVCDLVSHAVPSGQMKEVILYLAKKLEKSKRAVTSEAEVKREKVPELKEVEKLAGISMAARRRVFAAAKDCCQYRDPETGSVCESRRFLQADHIQPQWANGGHDIENLQVLCAVHNRMKYAKESGQRLLF